jgi:hypothetical protein
MTGECKSREGQESEVGGREARRQKGEGQRRDNNPD